MYFHGQRDAGNNPTDDFFRIQVSNDGGATYPAVLVEIGDVTSLPIWRELTVDLEDALPLTGAMRIRVQAADGPAIGDIVEAGIDDVTILDRGSGDEPPGAPALVAPPDGAGGQPPTPALVVANAVDPEGDPLRYGFRVYGDSLLTELEAAVDGVPPGALETTWTVSPPLAAGTYYWRAYAADAELRGPFMPAASFTVGGAAAVAAAAAPAPAALASAVPNPFGAATRIHYRLVRPGRVRLDVFDTQGRHVRRLVDGAAAAGTYEVAWDGRDVGGAASAAGVYLAQLRVDGAVATQKLVRLP
jgi:hypothetical protein